MKYVVFLSALFFVNFVAMSSEKENKEKTVVQKSTSSEIKNNEGLRVQYIRAMDEFKKPIYSANAEDLKKQIAAAQKLKDIVPKLTPTSREASLAKIKAAFPFISIEDANQTTSAAKKKKKKARAEKKAQRKVSDEKTDKKSATESEHSSPSSSDNEPDHK